MIPTSNPFPARWRPLLFVSGRALLAPTLPTLILVAAVAAATPAASDIPVQVIVDMDRETPGFQSDIRVPVGHAATVRDSHVVVVRDIAVWVIDPLGNRPLHSIGYLGGIDRAIAFGHNPSNDNQGQVLALEARAHTAVNPANNGFIDPPPSSQEGFAGPEVSYLEFGANAPAPISDNPAGPIFLADVTLSGAQVGDVFGFHLLDVVVVWSGGDHGAFSTHGPFSLDTGGDVIPDGTRTIYGVDPDAPVPVPPAAYFVNLIDGGQKPGPATITIVSSAAIEDPSAQPGAAIQLLRIAPNPFSQTTRIELAGLPAGGGAIRLSVFDIAGRRVRQLGAASRAAEGGTLAIDWDGRNDAGHDVPAGVYFCRPEVAGTPAAWRIVRLP